ncbi:hypothetical protein CICLE_v10017672mg [Citrus x clementina]|uniref:Uncharacterized protein n=1 Tax=Citrus clementina TaxID=85681 RepID=V4UEF6_CITCL|nr:hypothetical protein CICLE_v10017672mg [Citrus x clementina]
MACGALSLTIPLWSHLTSKFDSKRERAFKHQHATLGIACSNSSPDLPATTVTEKLQNDASVTGGAYDFGRATKSLTQKLISYPKKVTLVRHGLSSWNDEGRVQGSSNLSVLTEAGVRQAERCREALRNIYFDQCFSSPICRAKNLEAVDARQKYPKEYTTWREDPANFNVNGVYPGENFLVVTHKSILRALICTALGLGPERV